MPNNAASKMAKASKAKPSITAADRQQWTFRLLAIALVVTCYSLISHELFASVDFRDVDNTMYEEDTNDSAVRAKTGRSTSALGYLTLGVAGAACCLFKSNKTQPIRNLFVLLLFAYVAWLVLSGLWSIDKGMSIRKIAIAVLIAIGTFGVSRHLDLQDIMIVLLGATFLFVSFAFCIEVLLATFRPTSSLYRFSGTVHPNEQAMYSALLVISSWCVRPKVAWMKVGRIALIAFGLVAVYLTRSRTTLGAMGVAIFLSELLQSKASNRLYLVMGGLCTVSVVGLLASALGSWGLLGQAAAMGRTKDLSSLTGRLPLWTELWRYADNQLLMGHGYGAFWDSKMMYQMSSTFYWEIMNAHSTYLDSILALGLIGLALYVSFLFSSLGVSGYYAMKWHDTHFQFVFAILLFAIIHGVAESKFYEEGLGTYFLMLCLYRLAREKPIRKESKRPGKAIARMQTMPMRSRRRATVPAKSIAQV